MSAFPVVSCKTIYGDSIEFPKNELGNYVLVTMGFDEASKNNHSEWWKAVSSNAEFNHIRKYFVINAQDLNYFAQTGLQTLFKASTSYEEQKVSIALWKDKEAMCSVSGFDASSDKSHVWLIAVDKQGNVVWNVHYGKPDEASTADVFEKLRALN